ncbi:hypothetical protein NITMOv2_2928 [Nitrospira moscoviensis]|uniref:50S ribosomal protein L25 n=2 Tax=Nitrospira moscoviensis TaxID=42253 RepID=A0A0K2GEP0_NITMO|nr:hypothetical protein NITMOv2_2928 [Nitrospira moscoviensis]
MRWKPRSVCITDRAEVMRDVDGGLHLNPDWLDHLPGCLTEPGLRHAPTGARFEFKGQGYFCVYPDTTLGRLIFNRTVSLKTLGPEIQKPRP